MAMDFRMPGLKGCWRVLQFRTWPGGGGVLGFGVQNSM